MQLIQQDTLDVYVIKKKALLSKLLLGPGNWLTQPEEKSHMKMLIDWDGNYDQNLEAPTLYTMIEHQILFDLFKREIPDDEA